MCFAMPLYCIFSVRNAHLQTRILIDGEAIHCATTKRSHGILLPRHTAYPKSLHRSHKIGNEVSWQDSSSEHVPIDFSDFNSIYQCTELSSN